MCSAGSIGGHQNRWPDCTIGSASATASCLLYDDERREQQPAGGAAGDLGRSSADVAAGAATPELRQPGDHHKVRPWVRQVWPFVNELVAVDLSDAWAMLTPAETAWGVTGVEIFAVARENRSRRQLTLTPGETMRLQDGDGGSYVDSMILATGWPASLWAPDGPRPLVFFPGDGALLVGTDGALGNPHPVGPSHHSGLREGNLVGVATDGLPDADVSRPPRTVHRAFLCRHRLDGPGAGPGTFSGPVSRRRVAFARCTGGAARAYGGIADRVARKRLPGPCST